MANKITEKLTKIKQMLKDAMDAATAAATPPAPAAPAAPVDYTLADGTTVVQIDKLEVGGMVTVAGAAIPDGDITLADGTTITTVAGAITVITPKAAEEPDAADMSTPAAMRKYLEQFADTPPVAGAPAPDLAKIALILKAVFENVFSWEIRQAKEKADRDAAIAAYQSGFAAQKLVIDQHAEINKELFAAVELLSGVEIGEAVEDAIEWDKMTPLQQFKAQRGIE